MCWLLASTVRYVKSFETFYPSKDYSVEKTKFAYFHLFLIDKAWLRVLYPCQSSSAGTLLCCCTRVLTLKHPWACLGCFCESLPFYFRWFRFSFWLRFRQRINRMRRGLRSWQVCQDGSSEIPSWACSCHLRFDFAIAEVLDEAGSGLRCSPYCSEAGKELLEKSFGVGLEEGCKRMW